MKGRYLLVLLIALQLIISCKPEPLTDASVPVYVPDIYYGPFADNTLDVYLPPKRNGNTRTIILIHGGLWSSGDKSDMDDFAEYFASQGFACVTMNYRLAETNPHPAQLNDIAKVIDFVTSKALDFHISPTRFGLMGVTEGGHLALLYTYAANTNGKVKTVVSVSGISDFTDTLNFTPQINPYISDLVGSKLRGAYVQASPINHISASTKPTFIAHGKQDGIVLYEQSVNLKTKLDQFNVKNDLRLYNNEDHEFTSQATIGSLTADIAVWFGETLK